MCVCVFAGELLLSLWPAVAQRRSRFCSVSLRTRSTLQTHAVQTLSASRHTSCCRTTSVTTHTLKDTHMHHTAAVRLIFSVCVCVCWFAGGADVTFIRTLVNSSVNMDVLTFMSLKQSVINVSLLTIINFNYTFTHVRTDSELSPFQWCSWFFLSS